MWGNWINAENLSSASIAKFRGSIADGPCPVVQIDAFWRADRLPALAAAIRELPHWERLLVLREDDGAVRAVTDDEFSAAPSARHFSRHDRAARIEAELGGTPSISLEAQRLLRQFFAFAVLTPAFATWVGELFGLRSLEASSIEFARYGRGDYIAEHTDAVGDRVCHVVTYFDADYAASDGGSLIVWGQDGRPASLAPRFNSAVVLAIDAANRHRVEEWTAARPGRWTASIAFRARRVP